MTDVTLCLPLVEKKIEIPTLFYIRTFKCHLHRSIVYVYAMCGHPERKSRERLIVQL